MKYGQSETLGQRGGEVGEKESRELEGSHLALGE